MIYWGRVCTASVDGNSKRINEYARKGYPIAKTYLDSQKAFINVPQQGNYAAVGHLENICLKCRKLTIFYLFCLLAEKDHY